MAEEANTPETPPPADDFVVYSEQKAETEAPEAPAEPEPKDPSDAEPEAEAEPDEPEPNPASQAGRELAKHRGSLQARINTLTREKHSNARERDQARAEVAALRAQLDQRSQPPAEAPPAPADAHPAAPRFDEMPGGQFAKPTKDEIGTKYEDYEAYTEAMSQWAAEQGELRAMRRMQVEQTARQQYEYEQAVTRERQDKLAAHQQHLEQFRAEHADFNEVVTKHPDLTISDPMIEIIVEDAAGPAIAYWLGQHPEDCRRIAALTSPAKVGAELTAIKYQVAPPSTGPARSGKPLTKVPPPPKPVGASPTASTVPLDQLDIDDFMRVRNEQEFAARRR